MEYRYKKGQLFRKKLPVPKGIRNMIYNCNLTLKYFLEYDLDDKIPISCLASKDRQLVEKFGIDRIKTIDWELERKFRHERDFDFHELIMSIDSSVDDLNMSLYELTKDLIRPDEYTEKMKEVYSKRLIDESTISNKSELSLAINFNRGVLPLTAFINNWGMFKDLDLSYCLKKDKKNEQHITDEQLKKFMSKYEVLAPLIVENYDIYTFINAVNNLNTEEEINDYIKQFTDDILSNTIREYGDYRSPIKPTNDEYKEIFKYSSLGEYLKKFYYGDEPLELLNELEKLPREYIFNISISFSDLLNRHVISFINTFGLQNIVDFDNECGHFFSNNDCEMLKLMFSMYMAYAGNEHDHKKNIYYDKDGNHIEDGTYSKDQFYESMRRMIVYGPSDWNYMDKAPDYRNMTGEFKLRNQDLFISDDAPEELKKFFYTKSITPQLIANNPEFIQYLKGKDLSSCFKNIEIRVTDKDTPYGYINFYDFLSRNNSFDDMIGFVSEYSDIFDIIFDDNIDRYIYAVNYFYQDTIEQTKDKINDVLRRIIIERGFSFPKRIPEDLKNKYPTMFISDDAPQELQDAYYNRKISSEFILSNPNYIDFLKQVDLDFLYKYMPVRIKNENEDELYRYEYNYESFVSVICKKFGKEDSFDLMLLYGKYIEAIYEANKMRDIKLSPNMSKDDLLDLLDTTIYQIIVDGLIKYDEKAPTHFKNNYPSLFLNDDVPQKIRDKFYGRNFTLEDFDSNPDLIEIFQTTNIACGFPENVAWIIPLFSNIDNKKASNLNRLRVISVYSKIEDVELQKAFKEYVQEYGNDIDIDKIDCVSEVLSRLTLSNSSEIFTFRKELAFQILKSDNPIESLNKIEDVFIRNNIPTVGKVYSCFEILHPNFQGFDYAIDRISPALKKSSLEQKNLIIFSDLIKASFGSNNRSVLEYLKNIEIGSELYENIKSGKVSYETLDNEYQNLLLIFSNYLATIYNNTMLAKKKNDSFISTGDVLEDILELSKRISPNGTIDYNLGDRVIRMFCGLVGIDTLEQAKKYIERNIKTADIRNRNASKSDVVLEKGDFIKGIGSITYLRNILQNGSVSKEYLGSSADSDLTPLDTDVSMILNSEGTIEQKINGTAASSYGPIWFVLKNDDRFLSYGEDDKVKRDLSKLEVFGTWILGKDHYGIRTGFASSEINYIIMENYDLRVGLEIVMNGFYIPVANKEGKIVFTPDDYDKLRTKMSGLSYYGESNYLFSKNLIINDVEHFASQIEQSNNDVLIKRTKINDVIKKSLDELGLQLKTKIDGNLADGFVELIDTGSTGRGTNKPGDGDFDFMMRLDRRIISDPSKLNKLKEALLKNLGREHSSEVTGTGDFRLKNVQLDADTCVDIDITFTEKTDKVSYSTDMALQDRLATISKTDSEKYKYVVANILLAKKILKDAGCYKPYRSDNTQGGLGGVGIENWILQNGGSFVDAAKSFIDVAEGKSFSEFQLAYQIWDFGDNHLAERRGQYSHDNFVSNNMSEDGYYKMINALKEFLKTIEYADSDSLKR